MTGPNPLARGGDPSGQIPPDGSVGFTLDGTSYTVTVPDTRSLIESYAVGNWSVLVPAAVVEDSFGDRLMGRHDPLDLGDVETIALDVAATVAGCDFWAAARLCAGALSNWMVFDGWCITQGFDPLAVRFPRVVAAAYAWRVSMCSKDSEKTKLDHDLWQPVTQSVTGRSRDVEAQPQWTVEQESAAWHAAFARFGSRA